MHNTIIPQNVREMDKLLRGDRRPWSLDPKKTAHVVIDLQTGFIAPGSVSELPMNLEILPNVDKISAAMRVAGGLNIFIRFTYDPDWTAFYGRFGSGKAEPMKAAFTPGAEQHALWPGMDVQADDLVLDKTRFSALTPGTCDLDAELKARGIDTLVITGCVSNCCSESTVRDAVQLNYRAFVVADANAAFSDADHNGAITDLYSVFGCEIVTAEQVVTQLIATKKQT